MSAFTFTAKEKYDCAIREAAMRRKVYPAMVAQNRMTQAQAQQGVAIMEAIARDYRSFAPDLFSGTKP